MIGTFDESELNPWVMALLVVNFDEKHGQQIHAMYPRRPSSLTEDMLSTIRMMAMPDCLETGSSHEFIFMFRVRDKRQQTSGGGRLVNCYASFRQYRDLSTKRGFFQQSIVLVSRLTFSSLFYNILNRLSTVLAHTPGFDLLIKSQNIHSQKAEASDAQISANSTIDRTSNSDRNSNKGEFGGISTTTTPSSSGVLAIDVDCLQEPPLGSYSSVDDIALLDSCLEVAFQHFQKWPAPKSDLTYSLPFYGNVIKFTVPAAPLYTIYPRDYFLQSDHGSDLLKHGGLGGGVGLFSSINLVSVFDDLGLLPHLWTLWELVVTGQDIVVWSPSAAICSTVVTALVSLTAPLSFGGDYRPYINPYDDDIKIIVENINRKHEYTNSISAVLAEGRAVAISSDEGVSSSSKEGPPSAAVDEYCTVNDSQTPPHRSLRGPIYVRSMTTLASARARFGPSMIIGITNPILLRSFALVDAALLLPNPEQQKIPSHLTSKSQTSNISSPVTNLVHNNRLSPMGKEPSLFSSPIQYMTSFFLDSSDSGNGYNHYDDGKSVAHPRSPLPQRGDPRPKPSSKLQYSALGLARLASSPSNSVDGNKSPLMSSRSANSASSRQLSGSSKSSAHHSKRSFPTNVKTLGATDSIEATYDDWIINGGIKSGSSKKCGQLCIRVKPLLSPDPDIQQRLDSLGTGVVNVSSGANGVLLDEEEVVASNEKVVIGNMLLREHFRNMTMALIRPFDSYFKPSGSSPRIMTCDASWLLDKLAGTTSSSSLFCSTTMSGNRSLEDTLASIEDFASLEHNESQLPKCLRGGQWRVLMQLFAHTDHFTCWSDWKRDIIAARAKNASSSSSTLDS